MLLPGPNTQGPYGPYKQVSPPCLATRLSRPLETDCLSRRDCRSTTTTPTGLSAKERPTGASVVQRHWKSKRLSRRSLASPPTTQAHVATTPLQSLIPVPTTGKSSL